MNPTASPSTTAPPITPPTAKPMDADLAEQARPGYGIPSQDPRPEAQMPLRPEEAEREARSTLVGGGAMAGAATGAVIGVAAAGPVGVVVGATVGAVAGALGSAAVGARMNPDTSDDADASAVTATPTDTDAAAVPTPPSRSHLTG
jgi:hypothetical protein